MVGIVIEQGIVNSVDHNNGAVNELINPFRKFVRTEDNVKTYRSSCRISCSKIKREGGCIIGV